MKHTLGDNSGIVVQNLLALDVSMASLIALGKDVAEAPSDGPSARPSQSFGEAAHRVRCDHRYWWEIFHKILADSEEPLAAEIDMRQEFDGVLKYQYKGREVAGSLLFCAIEYCALRPPQEDSFTMSAPVRSTSQSFRTKQLCRLRDSDALCAEDTKKLLGVLLKLPGADATAWGSHKAGMLQTIHVAAGFGSVACMEAIKLSCGSDPEAWHAVVNSKTLLPPKPGSGSSLSSQSIVRKEHYSAIHDAVWFEKLAAVKWLLRELADPNATNAFGTTPLVLVAQRGLPDFVQPLLDSGGDLEKSEPVTRRSALSYSSSRLSRTDASRDENDQGITPLTAAINSTRFPADKFYLLAPSMQETNPCLTRFLRDVFVVAMENESACEMLVTMYCARAQIFSSRLPVCSGHTLDIGAESEMVNQLALILERAPRAASKIFEILWSLPWVENLEHHPLPRRATLRLAGFDQRMLCWYTDDAVDNAPCWRFDSETSGEHFPAWHTELAPNPVNRNDDKEVEIEVLRLPGLLNARIVRAFAMTTRLEIFAQKATQAIVDCTWFRLVKGSVWFFVLDEVFLMQAFYVWGSMRGHAFQFGSLEIPRVGKLCWAVATATLVKEVVVLSSILYTSREILGLPWIRCWQDSVCNRKMFYIVLLVPLIFVGRVSGTPRIGDSDWSRWLLAVNGTIRCAKTLHLLRAQTSIGPYIVCMFKTAQPALPMTCAVGLCFIFFLFGSILIRGVQSDDWDDGLKSWLLIPLAQALLVGDTGQLEVLQNMSGDNAGLQLAFIFIAILVFTISILNLLIAVYSNIYNTIESERFLHFYQERATLCWEILVYPQFKYLLEWLPQTERLLRVCYVAMVLVIAVITWLTLRDDTWGGEWLLMAYLAPCQLLIKAVALRRDWNDKHYLWVCCDKSFDPDEYTPVKMQDVGRMLANLQESLHTVEKSLESQISDVKTALQNTQESVRAVEEAVKSRFGDVHEVPCCKESRHVAMAGPFNSVSMTPSKSREL